MPTALTGRTRTLNFSSSHTFSVMGGNNIGLTWDYYGVAGWRTTWLANEHRFDLLVQVDDQAPINKMGWPPSIDPSDPGWGDNAGGLANAYVYAVLQVDGVAVDWDTFTTFGTNFSTSMNGTFTVSLPVEEVISADDWDALYPSDVDALGYPKHGGAAARDSDFARRLRFYEQIRNGETCNINATVGSITLSHSFTLGAPSVPVDYLIERYGRTRSGGSYSGGAGSFTGTAPLTVTAELGGLPIPGETSGVSGSSSFDNATTPGEIVTTNTGGEVTFNYAATPDYKYDLQSRLMEFGAARSGSVGGLFYNVDTTGSVVSWPVNTTFNQRRRGGTVSLHSSSPAIPTRAEAVPLRATLNPGSLGTNGEDSSDWRLQFLGHRWKAFELEHAETLTVDDGASAPASGGYDTTITGLSPDFRWQLDGNTNEDGGHSTSTNGTPYSFVTGIIANDSGQAMDFDGGNDYLRPANDPLINTGSGYTWTKRSVSFWMNADDVTGQRCIWEEGGGTNWMTIYLLGGDLYANLGEGNSSQGHATATVSASTTYHVCVVFDLTLGSNGIKIYLNGTLAGQASQTAGTDLAAHSGDNRIGHGNSRDHTNANSPYIFYNGRLQDFCYWNEVALTAAQVLSIYNAGTGSASGWVGSSATVSVSSGETTITAS